MSKQSIQKYRKEVLKSKHDSVKNGLEKSNFQNNIEKEDSNNSHKTTDERK